jgi:hypothetical protein
MIPILVKDVIITVDGVPELMMIIVLVVMLVTGVTVQDVYQMLLMDIMLIIVENVHKWSNVILTVILVMVHLLTNVIHVLLLSICSNLHVINHPPLVLMELGLITILNIV